MIDLHYEDDTKKNMIIAHGGAHLFKQPLFSFLYTIKNWLDYNKNDIITIHLESYIRGYDKIIKEIKNAELYDYLFDKSNFTSSGKGFRWPTLDEMRKESKGRSNRLVIFSDKSEDAGYGIMHVSETMETQYNLKDSPNCEMRREGRKYKAPVFVMNHFYSIMLSPKMGIASDYFSPVSDVNNYESIRKRVCKCLSAGPTARKWPNFIAVDFIGAVGGNEREFVRDINKRTLSCP